MDPNTQRAEAERWLGIAAKLLTARDFLGSRTFAIRAREADPTNAVSDQILAVVDTLLAADKRVGATASGQGQGQPDWYAVLQLPRLVRDPDLIAAHYRRLAVLLSPDRNRLPFADYALQLGIEAWTVLSDPTKKWLFDNELALSLQRAGPEGSSQGFDSGQQLNTTFQFFQQQPQQQQQQQPTLQMWQQQPQTQPQSQIEFMAPPQQTGQQQQQVPPQWQMRDPNPGKGGGRGDRSSGGGSSSSSSTGLVNGIGIGIGSSGKTNSIPIPVPQPQSVPVPRSTPPPRPRPAVTRPEPVARSTPPQAQPQIARPEPVARSNTIPAPTLTPTPMPTPRQVQPVAPREKPAVVTVSTVMNDGNAGNDSSNNNEVYVNVNEDDDVDDGGGGGGKEGNEGVEEDVESFWTACPYCLYIYEYQKVYQDCALRCQNQKCRRGFQAVQVPNPPTIGRGGGKDDKGTSFCCLGFFPLGFSMGAWKKHNEMGNSNGGSNWMPFSPMFGSPMGNGGAGFQWFANSEGTNNGATNKGGTGRYNVGRRSAMGPRVYADDDEDFLEESDPSDSGSSDCDWRTPAQGKKKKKQKKSKVIGHKRGRPPKGGRLNQGNQDSASAGAGADAVTVVGHDLEGGSGGQEVVIGLVAGEKPETRKNVASTVARKQTRRSVKDMGRLDLNVEFNNEGDEHAPTVNAVNREEEGIENIGFFEGLDEFLSTLPILNVGGEEKAKPS